MTVAAADRFDAGGKSRNGKFKDYSEKERARIEREEDEVTQQSDESFPASDPPSFTPVRGSKKRVPKPKRKTG